MSGRTRHRIAEATAATSAARTFRNPERPAARRGRPELASLSRQFGAPSSGGRTRSPRVGSPARNRTGRAVRSGGGVGPTAVSTHDGRTHDFVPPHASAHGDERARSASIKSGWFTRGEARRRSLRDLPASLRGTPRVNCEARRLPPNESEVISHVLPQAHQAPRHRRDGHRDRGRRLRHRQRNRQHWVRHRDHSVVRRGNIRPTRAPQRSTQR
jgi:hypothetical protein